MKALLLSALALSTLAAPAFAAPATYDAYCLVIVKSTKPGGVPPQGEVSLKLGESKELYREGDLSYEVSYKNDLGLTNVIELSVKNATNHELVGYTHVVIHDGKELPKQIDLWSVGGALSCFRP